MEMVEKLRRFVMSPNVFLGVDQQEALLLETPKINGYHVGNEETKQITSEKSKDSQMTYSEIVHHCESTSTFHGICHAGNALNQKSRLFWHVLFLICSSFLSIQMVYLYQKYIRYDKTVDLDIKFEKAAFPAVTFCNLNPYKASAIAYDPATRNTMDAFMSRIAPETLIEPTKAARKASTKQSSDHSKKRRYYQAYSKCFCESLQTPGGSGAAHNRSCFPGYQGKVEINLESDQKSIQLKSSKCLCQFDYVAKTLWPCFPVPSWKPHICKECIPELGDCPMKFVEANSSLKNKHPCMCNEEYNHCIANNDGKGEIPEVFSVEDLQNLSFESGEDEGSNETEAIEATTQPLEFRQAMGFDELSDEIAIHTQAQQNLMFAVGEKPINEKISLSHSKDDLILKCSFNQRDCDIEKDFILHHDSTYGNCYTFNWNRTLPVTVHRVGANYGLRILLFSNRSEYLPTSEAVGFRITIHDQWSYPFPDAFGYSAPTGFMSSFGVRMKQFNRIPPPYGQCLDGGENSEFYVYKGFNYSLEGCHRSCTQNEIIRVCGCADPLYPLPNNRSKTCSVNDPRGRECIKNVTAYINLAMNEGKLPNCSCHQPCSNTAYEVYYSASGWPSGSTKILECEPHDEICMEKYRKNAALIQVFYEELNQETLSETPAYTWMSLLADIGGLTGLWVGASVVSLGELVMLAYYSVQAYRKRSRRTYVKTIESERIKEKPSLLDRIFKVLG